MPFTRPVPPPRPGKRVAFASARFGCTNPCPVQLQRQLPRTGWRTPRASRTVLDLRKAPLPEDNRRPGVKKTVEIPKIPLDIASHKLYYVNLEMSPTNAPWPSPPMNLY